MLTHGSVNSIEDTYDVFMIQNVKDIKTRLLAFHLRFVEAGVFSICHKDCEECVIHPRGCKMMQGDIQDMMNQGVLQVSSLIKKEEIAVIESCFNLPEPVEINYQRKDDV